MAEPQSYSTIKFFLKHGELFAWLGGLLIAASGIWGTYASQHWICAVGGFVGGWFVFMLMRCFRELLALVADTLMPQ